ncbi:hypothetical protein [Jannaschia rubra]|uniref:Uncharacterized protein n=1 Tax=Jannaschia rubra TaxID=282197 RepID=A0A0M6XL74_9RHOB|nr:hypothetical protein [Jannaschia rubra]CTQ31668.1 hypothetical protein JAN5088_00426 [Jannaschia rubra]SFG82520.1 hypothetical protein SAMN04488517_11920 [Jannaschia rubra]
MSHDTQPPDRLEQINDRFDRMDARVDRLADSMATMRDLRAAVVLSTIMTTAIAGLVLWVAT